LEGVLVAVPEPLSPVEADKIKRTYERPALKQIVAGSEAGVQVGLADENGDTLALGVIQKFDFSERHIEIWTPLALGREDKVKILQFGTLRLTLDGREDGSVDAGKF
ncbi:MAG TPA: hypothetical protein P5079_06900, partial [Elusimicrobiota bacterium]|nr:hypothetical protein [Elusimicrobiota bacterium]